MIETIILQMLNQDESYCRFVFPFIKAEYFEAEYKKIFEEFSKSFTKYNKIPSRAMVETGLSERDDIFDDDWSTVGSLLDQMYNNKSDVQRDWAVEKTEEWAKLRASYNAIVDSVNIIEERDKEKRTIHAIPDLLKEAVEITFDRHIGHDYFDDAEERWNLRNKIESKIPFDLQLFNKITKGGLAPKTLNIILGGPHSGKTLFMCHFAASALSSGYNVLYITGEMSEEEIALRIDANRFNMKISDVEGLSKKKFMTGINAIRGKTEGRLLIKEYPTSTANVSHFRALLSDIERKQKWKPDVIIIDYLNIFASSKLRLGGTVNTYVLVKSVTEEMRALAVENNVPILTGTQLNREGAKSTDPDMTDTSESFGLPMTADFLFTTIVTEELEELNQVYIRQLKNRYNGTKQFERFVVGRDVERFRLFDINQSIAAMPTSVGGGGSPQQKGRKGKKKDDDKPVMDTANEGWGLKDSKKFSTTGWEI